ncbi:MAG: response regulator [Anaerolineae bacterium]|nr:response regulator [Anaerolineae bacterium]
MISPIPPPPAKLPLSTRLQHLQRRLRLLLSALLIIPLIIIGITLIYFWLNPGEFGLLQTGGIILLAILAAWLTGWSLKCYFVRPLEEYQAELAWMEQSPTDPAAEICAGRKQTRDQMLDQSSQPEVDESLTGLNDTPEPGRPHLDERQGAELQLNESEEFYRQWAEASPNSIAIHHQGKILFVNPAGAKLLGASSPTPLIGQSIAQFIQPHPRQNSKQSPPLEKAHEKSSLTEQKFIRLDGTEIEVEALETPFIYQGKLAVQLVARDLTAHNRTRAEILQRNHELTTLQAAGITITSSLDLRHVLDTVTYEMTKLLGVETCILSEWNPVEQTISGMAGYDPAGWWDSKSPAEIRLAEYPVTREVLEEQICEQMTLNQPNIDPAEFAYMRGANLKTRMLLPMIFKGQVLGLVELADSRVERIFTRQEISLAQLLANQAAGAIENARLFERLEEERGLLAQRVQERTAELSRANAELAKAARLKDEFLAGMSHELRTPLNSILGFAEILQNGTFGPLNERQLKFAKNIEESGAHLLAVINDILDLSKVEAGKMELEITPVSIEAVCEASLRMIRQLALKKQLQVAETVIDQVAEIQADERRLKQMLVNLLSNAVKFTPEGGQVGLEVRGDEAEQVVHFTVWDTGIGIAPEDLKRLFKPFVQLDSRLSRQYSGTGLGLSLVFRMAELHGGSVSLESQVNQGSRFTFSLPWTKPVRETSSTEEVNPEINLAELALAPNGQPYRILLADDNEDNISLFQDYLQAVGFQVTVVRNGKEAIERTQEEQPNLILMDIQMPVMDGLEATRHLRADGTLTPIPIIAVTSLAMPGDRERCLEAGANDYLSKPVHLEKLVKTIKAQLRGDFV